MYICDIKSQMKSGDDDTIKKWKYYTDAEIRSAMRQDNDQTRQTREQNRQQSTDTSNAPIGEYEIAWVHENFVRIDGKEWVYYTLSTQFMLTDPVPLKEVYFHGERPIIIGSCVIETHVSFPESPVLMAEQLQREVNEVANQRIDNVKLVLNKRYIVKRGAQVDLKSIVRNVPASITMANDPVGDVRTVEFNDVTASSYQEQDRLNVDYDELTGNFSQGSVMTNRKMGETVGGMGMISQAANQVTEYTIRTFTESWVEKVLRQLVKLEQKYESDEVILAIAAGKAKLFQKYGISQIDDSLLNQELTLNVNVGMGATDPVTKLNKFVGALSAYANVAAMQLPNADMEEIAKEIFGLAGYRDGARFSMQQNPDDPNQQIIQQAQQEIQAIQQQAQEYVQSIQQQTAEKEQALNDQMQKMQLTEKDIQSEINRLEALRETINMEQQLINEQISNANKQLDLEKQLAEEQLKAEASNHLETIATREAQSYKTLHESGPRESKLPDINVFTDKPNGLKQTKKEITIRAPSGQIYTGTIEDSGITVSQNNT